MITITEEQAKKQLKLHEKFGCFMNKKTIFLSRLSHQIVKIKIYAVAFKEKDNIDELPKYKLIDEFCYYKKIKSKK